VSEMSRETTEAGERRWRLMMATSVGENRRLVLAEDAIAEDGFLVGAGIWGLVDRAVVINQAPCSSSERRKMRVVE